MFPLFNVRPVTPPPPIQWVNATSMWSSARNDQVLCVSDSCFNANPVPSSGYVVQRGEGWAPLSSAAATGVVINGTKYATLKLTLFFAAKWNDNLITVNASADVPSEYRSGTVFDNGYVLATQAPGSLPLRVYYKQYSATSQDYATVASAAGVAWAEANGYAYQTWSAGFVLPSAPTSADAA